MACTEKDYKDHLVSTPLLQAGSPTTRAGCPEPLISSLALKASRDGASTTYVGNLSQGFTTLWVKNLLLISSLNLPSLSLKPLPLVLSPATVLNSHSPSSLYIPLKYWKGTMKFPQNLLFPKLSKSSSLNFSS